MFCLCTADDNAAIAFFWRFFWPAITASRSDPLWDIVRGSLLFYCLLKRCTQFFTKMGGWLGRLMRKYAILFSVAFWEAMQDSAGFGDGREK